MKKILVLCLAAAAVLLALGGAACGGSIAETQARNTAEAFVRNEATFKFDGEAGTLKLGNTAKLDNAWKFTYEYESSHAGYGDRTGQFLAQVITRHTAVVIVTDGKVTSGIIDNAWNMLTQQTESDVTIDLAPIEAVTVSRLKTNPAQIEVYIKGGLRDGCTAFYNLEVTRDGDTVNIKVTTQRPREAMCPAIYTYFEKTVNLGSDFTTAATYNLNVNDFKTTFVY